MRQPVSPITTMRCGIRLRQRQRAAADRRARDAWRDRLFADEHRKCRRLRIGGCAPRRPQRRSSRVARERPSAARRPSRSIAGHAASVVIARAIGAALLAQHDERVAASARPRSAVARRSARNPPTQRSRAASEIAARHRQSPHKSCSAASAAIAAVSVRSTRGPSRSAMKPAARPRDLARVESALRPDQERERRRRQRDGARATAPRPGRNTMPLPRHASSQSPSDSGGDDVGNAIAPALLARGDDDVAPVREPLVAALARRQRRAARGDERLDRGDAELGRLAHRVVHRVVGRDRLRQRDVRAATRARPASKRVDARRRRRACRPAQRRRVLAARSGRTASARRRRRAAGPASHDARPRPAARPSARPGRARARAGLKKRGAAIAMTPGPTKSNWYSSFSGRNPMRA